MMEEKLTAPLVSVIVPVYNVEAYLKKCIESIIAQTYEKLEIIFVDDGSTDNSLEILCHYQKLDDRIKVIHKKNGGLVSARKAGIQQAEGEYVACVDSDDWVDPELFECLMKKAIQYDADVVTSGCIREYGNGSVVQKEEISEGFYEAEKLQKEFLPNMIGIHEFFCQRIMAVVWGKVYKTDLYKKYQLLVPNDCTIGEDQACTYPVFLHAEKVYVLGKEMYHYRQRASSMCGTEKRSIEVYRPVMLHLRHYFQNAAYPESMEQFSRVALYSMLFLSPEQVWQYQKNVPFSALPKGNVLLYGMGRFGKALAASLKREKDIRVVGYLDKAPRDPGDGLPCCSLIELKDNGLEYDYIIVSALHVYAWKEIQHRLIEFGISEEKIICPNLKNAAEVVNRITIIEGQ